MPASKKTQEFVEKELPYKLLAEMYKNSRKSLKGLGRSLKISYHTVSKSLAELDERYGLAYTLDLDTGKLGFPEGRIITIRFGERPELDILRQRVQKDIFVQDAYLAEGDFDLLLYVVGLSPREFIRWQWKFRIDFKKYRPLLRISTADLNVIGFFPVRNELIDASEKLSDTEKKVLQALNTNSRIKLKDLISKAKTTQMRVIYVLKKLTEAGIIRRYAALVQKPSKRIFMAYTMRFTPGENH
ncbi:MAG: Lrp/AsnC family transcriptional regulator, partial [Candidatus Marsarchaeota archaeon]|nr:Lrp/AsnC family transcriptional regulator [Candidatus Marsarchaeota archaeon]